MGVAVPNGLSFLFVYAEPVMQIFANTSKIPASSRTMIFTRGTRLSSFIFFSKRSCDIYSVLSVGFFGVFSLEHICKCFKICVSCKCDRSKSPAFLKMKVEFCCLLSSYYFANICRHFRVCLLGNGGLRKSICGL